MCVCVYVQYIIGRSHILVISYLPIILSQYLFSCRYRQAGYCTALYVWPTVCTAVMFTAFLDCCFVVVVLFFPSLVGNLEYVNVTAKYVLCAKFCFENYVTPCLNQTTITS